MAEGEEDGEDEEGMLVDDGTARKFGLSHPLREVEDGGPSIDADDSYAEMATMTRTRRDLLLLRRGEQYRAAARVRNGGVRVLWVRDAKDSAGGDRGVPPGEVWGVVNV